MLKAQERTCGYLRKDYSWQTVSKDKVYGVPDRFRKEEASVARVKSAKERVEGMRSERVGASPIGSNR